VLWRCRFSPGCLIEKQRNCSLNCHIGPRWRHLKNPWPAPVVSSPSKTFTPKTFQFWKIESATLPAFLQGLNSSFALSVGQLRPQMYLPNLSSWGTSCVKQVKQTVYGVMSCWKRWGTFLLIPTIKKYVYLLLADIQNKTIPQWGQAAKYNQFLSSFVWHVLQKCCLHVLKNDKQTRHATAVSLCFTWACFKCDKAIF